MKYNTVTVNSLSDFIKEIETRLLDRYRIVLFRGQNVDKALIPNIARYLFKKSREKDEQRMLNDFTTKSLSHLEFAPTCMLEEMTVAQHHGVPIRLLDWTENALTALYFATSAIPEKRHKNAVVWVLSLARESNLI